MGKSIVPPPVKGARLQIGGLTGTVWVLTKWRVHADGTIEALEKFDVTADFYAAARLKGLVNPYNTQSSEPL